MMPKALAELDKNLRKLDALDPVKYDFALFGLEPKKTMKKILQLSICLLTTITLAQSRTLPIDTVITTQHNATINGATFSYTAQTGTQPVWDENAKPIASLHYTYYTRNNIKNRASRPLLISFNGGYQRSGSVWMHLAYTGPRILKIDDEGVSSSALVALMKIRIQY
ncbi:unnamed protein product [Bathycoccus prasinos]